MVQSPSFENNDCIVLKLGQNIKFSIIVHLFAEFDDFSIEFLILILKTHTDGYMENCIF